MIIPVAAAASETAAVADLAQLANLLAAALLLRPAGSFAATVWTTLCA